MDAPRRTRPQFGCSKAAALLDFHFRASFFELFLDLFSFFFRSAFFDRLRSTFNELFSFFQAETRNNFADYFNHVDFLSTAVDEDYVELSFFFSWSSVSARSRTSYSYSCSSFDATLFEVVVELFSFENGECEKLITEFSNISHFSLSFSK